MKDRTAELDAELKKDGLKSFFNGSRQNSATGKNKNMGRPTEKKRKKRLEKQLNQRGGDE